MGTCHSTITIYTGTSQWVHVTVQYTWVQHNGYMSQYNIHGYITTGTCHSTGAHVNYKMDTSQWIHVTLTVHYVNAANYKHICHSIAKTVTLCVHQQTVNVYINVCHSIAKTVTLCVHQQTTNICILMSVTVLPRLSLCGSTHVSTAN